MIDPQLLESQNPEDGYDAEPQTGYPVEDLTQHFVQISFTPKDDPSKL